MLPQRIRPSAWRILGGRKRGDLRTAFGKAPRSFERKLLAFLHKQGYR